MSNWVKKVVQKRNEQKKAEKKEHKLTKCFINSLCALIILGCTFSFLETSFNNYGSELGCALATFSLCVTTIFEAYEWIMLLLNHHKFRLEKSKDLFILFKDSPISPAVISVIFFFLIYLITNFEYYDYSNMISSLTICIYIFSILFRNIYSIFKED